jgi:hypothetical protein
MGAAIDRNGRPARRTSPPLRERAPGVLPRFRPVRYPVGRRLVAILALYALALQSILGGMALAAAAAPEHVLCLGGTNPDGSASDVGHLPHQEHAACCTACHRVSPIVLPDPLAAASAPTAYPVATPRKRPKRIALPRAPPGRGPGARAPPRV